MTRLPVISGAETDSTKDFFIKDMMITSEMKVVTSGTLLDTVMTFKQSDGLRGRNNSVTKSFMKSPAVKSKFNVTVKGKHMIPS